MKKIIHYFTTIITVFVFGYLLWHSADVSDVETNDLSKEIGFQFQQNDYHFNAEGIQKESISLKSNQNQTNVSEVVRKQLHTLLFLLLLLKLNYYKKIVLKFFSKIKIF